MALTIWIYFVINLWIELLMSTPHLVDVAKRQCPYSDFCTIPRAFNFTQTDDIMPCCSQCSCDASCWKLDICCPDSDSIRPPGSTTFSLECATTWFKYFDNHYTLSSSMVSYQQYRIKTTCPDTYEDTIIKNKCVNSTMFMPESYDDIVVVSDATYHDIIFRNKYCAECNGVKQIQRWSLLTTLCISSTLPETKYTGPELYKFIIRDCIVSSIPTDMVTLTYNALCSNEIISSCNVTGQWDSYDEEIDKACSTFYSPYTVEQTRYSATIYQNVFCGQCNRGPITVSNIVGTELSGDLCQTKWLNNRSPLTSNSLSAFLDTSLNHAALEARHNSEPGICAVNEVHDQTINVCRHLYCPMNSNPFNGKCLSNSLDIFGFGITFQLTFVPTDHASLNNDTILVKRISVDILRKMRLTHCVKCIANVLINTNEVDRVLKSVIFELTVRTDEKLCRLNEINLSLRQRIQNKQFNLKTKEDTISTTARVSYEYFDKSGPEPEAILDVRHCTYSEYLYKLTPVFFCPYVVMNETEFEHFLRKTQSVSNVNSVMLPDATNINAKFFKITSANKTSPHKYATCVENILWPRSKGGRICCSSVNCMCFLMAGIIYFYICCRFLL